MLTNGPIKAILSEPDLLTRIKKGTIELSFVDIKYRPQSAAKGQVIVEFLVEFIPVKVCRVNVRKLQKSTLAKLSGSCMWMDHFNFL